MLPESKRCDLGDKIVADEPRSGCLSFQISRIQAQFVSGAQEALSGTSLSAELAAHQGLVSIIKSELCSDFNAGPLNI